MSTLTPGQRVRITDQILQHKNEKLNEACRHLVGQEGTVRKHVRHYISEDTVTWECTFDKVLVDLDSGSLASLEPDWLSTVPRKSLPKPVLGNGGEHI